MNNSSEISLKVKNARIDIITEALSHVEDPEVGVNIVDLGLVYDVEPVGEGVVITMTLTSPACPLQEELEEEIEFALRGLVSYHEIKWTWMPPWSTAKVTDEGRSQLLYLGVRI